MIVTIEIYRHKLIFHTVSVSSDQTSPVQCMQVSSRIIHHRKGRLACWAGGAGQLTQKRHHMLTADAGVVDFKVQLCGSAIQRVQQIHPLAPELVPVVLT